MKTYYITWRNSLLQLPQYPYNIDRKPGNMGRTLAFPCTSGITVLVSMAKITDTVFPTYSLLKNTPPQTLRCSISHNYQKQKQTKRCFATSCTKNQAWRRPWLWLKGCRNPQLTQLLVIFCVIHSGPYLTLTIKCKKTDLSSTTIIQKN